jgi:cephalosporin-C deacetylase-like acetyl esterase
VTPYGTETRSGYRIEKFVYESEPGITIPAFLAIPTTGAGKRKAIIYVDGSGKAMAAAKIDKWIAEGKVVLAMDIRGLGELASERTNDPWFGDAASIQAALLIGRTMVGMRALDITRAVDLLTSRPDVDPSGIETIGIGRASVPVLYAAAFDKRIQAVELEGLLASYQSIIDSKIHRQVFEQIVQGAIRDYDLPDLVKTLAPRRVAIRSKVDAMGEPLASGDMAGR